jgi:hypothetical protein
MQEQTSRATNGGRRDEEAAEAPVDPREILAAAASFAKDNPHAALAGAFAVGFLLGGGLTPRLLASAALVAGKRYLAENAREALMGAVRKEIDEGVA